MEEVNLESGMTGPDKGDSQEYPDPFSAEHAPGLSLIILMRIYDIEMARFRNEYPEQAEKLLDLHAEGRILGPLPDYTDE